MRERERDVDIYCYLIMALCIYIYIERERYIYVLYIYIYIYIDRYIGREKDMTGHDLTWHVDEIGCSIATWHITDHCLVRYFVAWHSVAQPSISLALA